MLVRVKVFPDASSDTIVQKSNNSFEVTVREKPQTGRANQAVKRILAIFFKTTELNIRLIKGFKERNKIFDVGQK